MNTNESWDGDQQPQPLPVDGPSRGLWSRMGILGQVVTGLLGLLTAVLPVLLATDVFDPGGGPNSVIVTSVPPNPSTPVSSTPVEDEAITLTISDQLTEGALEETIVVVLEGSRVATLTANSKNQIVTQRVTATSAGNYDYVLDATISWLDEDGIRQEATATGRGSVYIDDGMRLDVYLHIESDGGVSLSLQSADA